MASSAAGSARGGRKEEESIVLRLFGIAGPAVMTAVWTVAIFVLLWAIEIPFTFLEIPGLSDLLSFFRSGILYISLCILFLSYCAYFMKRCRKALLILLPPSSATLAVSILWLTAGGLSLSPQESLVAAGAYAGQFMYHVFFALLTGGYAIVVALFILKRSMFSDGWYAPPASDAPGMQKETLRQDDETMRRELKATLKEAEKKYLQRKIDRETFDKMARDYHEKMTVLDARKGGS